MTVTIMQKKVPEAFSGHLFAIGQAVRFRGNAGWPNLSSGIYHVTGTRPVQGGAPQYRIRSDDESHERVVTEKDLELVDMSRADGGETLIEKTFGARTKK